MNTFIKLLFLFRLLCIFGTSTSNSTSQELSVGDQTKILTGLDTAILGAKGYAAMIAELNKAVDGYIGSSNTANETVNLAHKQTEALKSVRNLEYTIKALQIASAIVKLDFIFFKQSKLEVTLEKFNEVNRKFDSISDPTIKMAEEIKPSVKYTNIMESFLGWETRIFNGYYKWKNTRNAIKPTNEPMDNLKIAEIYIDYFEENNIEECMRNIYRVATTTQSTTHHNLFEKFKIEHRCDVKGLMKLFVLVKGLLQNGAEQSITYYQYKGMTNEAEEVLRYAQKALYDIKQKLDLAIVECMKQTIDFAAIDIKEIIDTNYNAKNDWLVRSISNKLVEKYPWYSWSAAVLDELDDSNNIIKSDFVDFNLVINRGSSFEIIRDYGEEKKNVIFVWQDSEIKLNCHHYSNEIDTMVLYKCFRCTNDHLIIDPNMFSYNKCGLSLLDEFDKAPNDGHTWLIAAIKAKDSCIGSNFCGDHGTCYKIQQKGESQCVCNSFYEGERCQHYVIVDSQIESSIADFRTSYLDTFSVPTNVDIYFEFLGVSKKMDKMMHDINVFHKYGNEFTKHSEDLKNANYIVNKYHALQQDAITMKEFVKYLDDYFHIITTFDFVSTRVRDIILGQSFYYAYKKEFIDVFKMYISKNLGTQCTSLFNDQVISMLNNLTILDHAISEAYLVYLMQKSKTVDLKQRSYIRTKAMRIKSNGIQRQTKYQQHYEAKSCPSLEDTEDMVNKYCTDVSSFEGMIVDVKCASNRQFKSNKIECTRVNNTLQWDRTPICENHWTEWSSWTECSKTCGGGIQIRNRACIGRADVKCGGEDQEKKECSTQSCCQTRYGKFQCKTNDECIDKTKLCDGTIHCTDGSDESKEECPDFIYHADYIALKNMGVENHWLSCYCESECKSCKTKPCPGDHMDHLAWTNCGAEIFYIRRQDENNMKPIKTGDWIYLPYSATSYFTCFRYNDECTKLYSSRSYFQLEGESQYTPIKRNDTILLKYLIHTEIAYYLKGNLNNTGLSECPRELEYADALKKCKNEAWKIYRK